jgi:adenylate cyclase
VTYARAVSTARAHGARPTAALAAILVTLPLIGLVALLGRPGLDGRWEHHPAHFWLVLAAAALTMVLAYATGTAARRRSDARVFLLSLAFLATAGFLGLHALATPGVLLERANAGFVLAMPVGLVLAGALATASSAPLGGTGGPEAMRRLQWLRIAVVAALVSWGLVSLGDLPPLEGASVPERTSGPLIGLAILGVCLFAAAVAGYLVLFRRRRASLPLTVAIALTLLAEAMLATAVGRNWHASWWEWHLLVLGAVTLVASAVHRQWHEERFSDLYVDGFSGGAREMSVLFADLQGFTRFSELHTPGEVSRMLNEYFRVAIPPVVRRHGGEIDRIVGDALMATFGPRPGMPDHAERAARAALALQEATARIAEHNPQWPRFRAGVNTGQVMAGVLGAEGGRTYSVVGDAVNVAARLEGIAPVGGVAVGIDTAARLRGARTEPLGPVHVSGRTAAVEVLLLHALAAEGEADAESSAGEVA